MKVLVGFEWVKTVEINGEEYVRLQDVPRMVHGLAVDRILEGARQACTNMVLSMETTPSGDIAMRFKEKKDAGRIR